MTPQRTILSNEMAPGGGRWEADGLWGLRAVPALAVAGAIIGVFVPGAEANPVGPAIARGVATFQTQGSQLTIRTGGNTFINWQSFNIGASESTVFVEPSARSIVWNRIGGASPSQILGKLSANGLVILQNPAGFYVGGQASIETAGLIMTSAPTTPPDFLGNGMFQFNCPPPTASIINYGQVTARAGGSIFLIAHDVENHGTISAPGGNIGLYAGKEVLVTDRSDGHGLSARVVLPEGSVDNSGKLIADAGTIAMNAQVVNDGGLIQANSVRERDGKIELIASESVNLGASAVIEAKGDTTGMSDGGRVTIKSGDTFSDQPTASIDVSGGIQGGNGGNVEVSATHLGAIESSIQAGAAAGWSGGSLLIDPQNITLVGSGGTTTPAGLIPSGYQSSADLSLNVGSFSSFSQILLQASQNITVSTLWNLSVPTGPHPTLTLEAGNNIIINTGDGISAGNYNWSINLIAGANFSQSPLSVLPGTGAGSHSITLNGTAFVQASSGNITMRAGQDVTVSSGAIRTTGGGSINVAALNGNVNSGVGTGGYTFSTSEDTAPYSINGNLLSGISTAAGGDVTISAGGNVTSLLPTGNARTQSDAGSGAFGPQPGDVTITAGGNVVGHYVEANGIGTINVGKNAGTTGTALALSLIAGGWNVNAPNGSIILQEVRNPNGALNGAGSSTSGGANPNFHLFDYSPTAFLNLDAGNAVQFLGVSVPRVTGDGVLSVGSSPLILPAILNIDAAAGGVALGRNLVLDSSPSGQLDILTTGGGSLASVSPGSIFSLAMSDSGLQSIADTTGLNAFTFGHAGTPVHEDDSDPVVFDISGNVRDWTLYMPKETQITVAGNMDNSAFTGQNLHPSDVTYINVAGHINNPTDLTFIPLATGQTYDPKVAADIFQNAVQLNADGSVKVNSTTGLPDLLFPSGSTSLIYIAASGGQPAELGYEGSLDPNLGTLLSPANGTFTVLVRDKAGNLSSHNGVFDTTTETLIDPSVIQNLVAQSKGVSPIEGAGYQIGGPGQFNITAASMDLGVDQGILSCGPGVGGGTSVNNNPALTGKGADINVTVAGDLNMYSATIGSLYDGNINITVGGEVNLGQQNIPGSSQNPFARGIWSAAESDVTVAAQGDINVSGSRIATYGGGNVILKSLMGSVNAGNGGSGKATIPRVQVVNNPKGPGMITAFVYETINGSGVLAETYPDAPPAALPGDITITTPRGDINASEGGITQLALNGNLTEGPTITLTAGTRAADGSIIYKGNIDLLGSGAIGGNINLSAAGDISGVVVAQHNTSLDAADAINATVLAGGNANVVGGTIGGTIIAVGNISASGDASGATFLSSNPVNVGGQQVQSSLANSTAASSTSASATQEANNDTKAATQQLASADDDPNKKGRKGPALRKVSRVTVILPPA